MEPNRRSAEFWLIKSHIILSEKAGAKWKWPFALTLMGYSIGLLVPFYRYDTSTTAALRT